MGSESDSRPTDFESDILNTAPRCPLSEFETMQVNT